MSEDLIKRSAAIRALNREKSDWNCDYNVPTDNCIKRLNKVKSADRPQGEWIEVDDASISCRCSVCGWEAHLYEDDVYGMPYCPNCGAKMKGASND